MVLIQTKQVIKKEDFMRDSNKAKLSKILGSSLANQRAAKDLQGLTGIKGGFVVDMSGATPITTTVTTTAAGTVEVQTITFSDVPDGGNFTLTYGLLGDTGSLAHTTDAAALEAAIQGIDASLSSVTVTGDYATGFVITFTDVVAPTTLTMTANTLVTGAVPVTETITITTPWVANAQKIAFSDVPTTGALSIDVDGNTLSGYDETTVAGDIQTDLQALGGDFATATVTGSYASGFTFTFVGSALPIGFTIAEDTNTLTRPGVDEVIDVGTGFSTEFVAGSTAAFNIYLDKRPENFLGGYVNVFEVKAIGTNGDSFMADISDYDFDAARPYVTVRIVDKVTGDVYAPLATCVYFFDIKCTYSDETGY
jgi:hypothetical protein